MNSPRALVTVVITCFNQAHYLSEAIESALAQTFPNVDLIVVDDGSRDNTREIAGRYSAVRYIRQTNQGLAGARNAGIAACRGEFVVFLDSDDRLMPTALEIGLKELSRRPDCGFVAGSHRMIGFDGSPLWEHALGPDEDNLYRALLRRNFIAMHAAVVYQRFVFEAVGAFDAAPRSTEDYDMYLRVARRCPIGLHPAIVAEYRRHSGSMTRDPALVLRSSLLSLERQVEHAATDPESFRAYQAGRRFVRSYYGAQLARFVEDRVIRREWKAAAAAAITLLRLYPQGLLRL